MKRARRNRVRTELIKLDAGDVIDEDHSARGFRREPTAHRPFHFIEPFTRLSLYNWRIGQTVSDSPQVLPTIHDLYVTPSSSYLQADPGFRIGYTQFANRALLEAPFIATAWGLCRYQTHPVRLVHSGGTYAEIAVEELQPVGAYSYLGGFCTTELQWYTSVVNNIRGWVPGHVLNVNDFRHNEAPWVFQGSGCLPVLSMWQPLPWARPEPRFLRGLNMYGSQLLLKYSSLELKVQPLMIKGKAMASGLTDVSETKPVDWGTGSQLFKSVVDPVHSNSAHRFTVIMFYKRRSSVRGAKDDRPRVHVPLVYDSAYRSRARMRYTSTTKQRRDAERYDETMNVHRMPTDKRFKVVFRRSYVVKNRRMQERGYAVQSTQRNTALNDAGFPADVQLCPTGINVTTRKMFSEAGSDVTGVGFFKSAYDIDGLPNRMPTRYVRFKRKLHGQKLSYRDHDSVDAVDLQGAVRYFPNGSWDANGPINMSMDPTTDDYKALGEPMHRSGELFVTVVTNANLRKYATGNSFQLNVGTDSRTWNPPAWQLSHKNDEPPMLVSIRNRIWYTDVAPAVPRNARVGANLFGNEVVLGPDEEGIPTVPGVGDHGE